MAEASRMEPRLTHHNHHWLKISSLPCFKSPGKRPQYRKRLNGSVKTIDAHDPPFETPNLSTIDSNTQHIKNILLSPQSERLRGGTFSWGNHSIGYGLGSSPIWSWLTPQVLDHASPIAHRSLEQWTWDLV